MIRTITTETNRSENLTQRTKNPNDTMTIPGKEKLKSETARPKNETGQVGAVTTKTDKKAGANQNSIGDIFPKKTKDKKDNDTAIDTTATISNIEDSILDNTFDSAKMNISVIGFDTETSMLNETFIIDKDINGRFIVDEDDLNDMDDTGTMDAEEDFYETYTVGIEENETLNINGIESKNTGVGAKLETKESATIKKADTNIHYGAIKKAFERKRR